MGDTNGVVDVSGEPCSFPIHPFPWERLCVGDHPLCPSCLGRKLLARKPSERKKSDKWNIHSHNLLTKNC